MLKKIITTTIAAIAMFAASYSEINAQITPQKYYQAANNGAGLAVFNSNYHTRMQNLYLTTDFNVTPTAGNISKIYMRAAGGRTNATFINLIVRMGTTNATQLTNAPWSNTGLDTVFFSALHVFPQVTGNQWFEIELDQPFYWNGTSNLIVDIAQDSFNGGFALQFNNPGGSPAPRNKYGPQNGPVALSNFPPVFFGYDACINPEFSLGSDTSVCDGQQLTLDAGTGNFKYIWNTNDTTQTIDVNTGGLYTVTVNDGTCSATDSITVSVNEAASVDGINFTNTSRNTFNFSAVNPSNATSYYWDFGDGNNSTLSNPTHDYDTAGEYTVTLIVSNECGSDTITNRIYATFLSIDKFALGKELKLYPNPADKEVTIATTSSSMIIEEVQIANILGQQVSYIQPKSSTSKIDVTHLVPGMYLVQIKTNQGYINTKLEIK